MISRKLFGPPGTGKTTVGSVAAAKYLLENRRGRIIYMCYTNFAAARAKEKLNELGLDRFAKVLEHDGD